MRVKKRLELAKKLSKIVRGDYRFFTGRGAEMIRNDIIGNILKQRTPEGEILKRNEPETRRYKRRILGHDKSLIWYRILINPATWITKGLKNKATVTLKAVRKEIGKILETRGYRFFGISSWVRENILKEFRNMIKRGLR